MNTTQNINIQEENDFQKFLELIKKNYKLFIISISIAAVLAFIYNYISTPEYKVTSSILIKEDNKQANRSMGDFLNSNLFGTNTIFENELWVIKSFPVIEQIVQHLDLSINYYKKENFRYLDYYQKAPFKVLYIKDHLQPVYVKFRVVFNGKGDFNLEAKSEKVSFYNFRKNSFEKVEENWQYKGNGKVGSLIENKDFSFVISTDSLKSLAQTYPQEYYFEFIDTKSLMYQLKSQVEFNITDKKATVIELGLRCKSVKKGIDIVNELMDVYSKQNLERKNHEADVTIDYIDKELNEISDSLTIVEQDLQKFRSSNQLLDVTAQSNIIANQYRELQNQLAELVTKKRYYDYVFNYLQKNDDFSNIGLPTSMGVQDQLLNTLLSDLISAQAQRTNLIESNQEKNPLVKRLSLQIETTKKNIIENISSVRKANDLSIDEMNKRITRVEAEINRMPQTQRLLGGIERKYRLNDAINNYLLEKRAEAKITKASNLPNNLIIEPARQVGLGPIAPNKSVNYLIAIVLGIVLPFMFLTIRTAFNQKIENQESVERITDIPVLGKILHNNKKTVNVLHEFPNSNIAESFRTLRTNLNYLVRGHKKIIMVTSSIEGEGKSFNALNIAMSYAQLNRPTILIDFDLRKNKSYFSNTGESLIGLSSYLINRANLDDIIIKSPNEKLDYIASGPIPPNPMELLALEKTEKLISRLKEKYDYIILDTPPLGQASDGYLLFEYTDLKIIVVRYNFTPKKVFALINKDLKNKNVSNMCIVLNDNRYYRDQYGYGYGYYNRKDNESSKNKFKKSGKV